jgi:hypothetical protein
VSSPHPLYLVVSSEDGLFVVGGAFHDRHNADTLAGVLRGFAVVRIDPPEPAAGASRTRAFVCQLEPTALRVFELGPHMGAHAIVCRHGPSELVWATDEDAARDTARALLAGADPARTPWFVAASVRKTG